MFTSSAKKKGSHPIQKRDILQLVVVSFSGINVCSKASEINGIDDQIMDTTHTCSRLKCEYPWAKDHSKARQINGLNNQIMDTNHAW